MKGTVNVLFVCLGNICRSPMAEAVLRDLVNKEGLADRIRVSSCGTGDWHVGSPPHHGTREILRRRGISYAGQRARVLDREEAITYDYIVAMDRQNVADIVDAGVPPGRVNLLSDFIDGLQGTDVPDPYFDDNFDEVYDLITRGSEGLLRHILANKGVRA